MKYFTTKDGFFSGNVGIGTTNPGYNLTVVDASPIISAQSTGGNQTRALLSAEDDAVYVGSTYSVNSIPLVFTQAGTSDGVERMRIDSSGRVGIGTTSPREQLHLGSDVLSDKTAIRLENLGGYSLLGIARLNDQLIAGSTNADLVISNNESRSIILGTNNTERMRIDSAGNVGIGTTDPDTNIKLHIQHTESANFKLERNKVGHTNIQNGYLQLSSTESANHIYSRDLNNDDKDFLIHAGNVGIGTTSPDETLHVSSAAGPLVAILEHTDGGSSELAFKDSQQQNDIRIGTADAGFRVFTADQERMRIDSDGNVGIGTSSPRSNPSTTNLHVSDSQVARVIIESTATSGKEWGLFSSATGVLGFYDYDTATEAMRIDSSGNVGIGTTNPSAKLQVHGDILSAGSNISVTNGGSASGVGMYSPESNEMGLCVNSNEAIRIDSARNVGIGTTNPESELHIKGDITFSGETTQNQGTRAEIVHTSGVDANGDESSNDGGLLFKSYDNSTAVDALAITHNGKVGIGTTNPYALLDIKGPNAVGTFFSAMNNGAAGASFKRVNENSYPYNHYIFNNGHVGIGTTSPSQPLEIKAVEGQFGCHVVDNQGISYGGLYVQSNGGTGSGLALYLKEPAGQTSARISADSVNPSYVKGKFGIGTANPNATLQVVGSVSKSSGSFRIDHPVKPETHDLVHSFVEAPQADNIYRGKVDLVAGKAEVNIDSVAGMTEGTFVLLNREIQVFTSNESDWDAVRGKVEGNKLIIECQNAESTATISWLVIGERQDKHMYDTEWTDDDGKVIVEPLKPEPQPEYEEVEPAVEEASEESVAEEAQPEEVATEEPQEVAQVSLGASISSTSLDDISNSRAEEL